MTYVADFADAHRRHWDDAEVLFQHARWANADQLYGFSAECGLKTVMRSLGMPVNQHGVPEKQYRKHVQEVWPIFQTFVAGHGGQWYLKQLPTGNPFHTWSHHDRYASTVHFSEQSTVPHQHAAKVVFLMLQRAIQDGRL